jgi:hypothetical protein
MRERYRSIPRGASPTARLSSARPPRTSPAPDTSLRYPLMSMRLRLLALVLIGVFMARTAPCVPQATGGMSADCCDEGTCPDPSAPSLGINGTSDAPCCAIAAEHREQSHAQLIASPLTFAEPLLSLSAPVAPSRQSDRADRLAPAARSAPLYVLYSVFLV